MYFYCYFYVFLLLCMFYSVYSVFIVPTGSLRLPWLRFFRAFSSVVSQMPVQSILGSRTPRILNSSVYEQIFRTQSVSDDVLCLELRTRKPSTSWSDKLGVSASAVFVEEWSSGKKNLESTTPICESVSCCVAFVHSNSLCLLFNPSDRTCPLAEMSTRGITLE